MTTKRRFIARVSLTLVILIGLVTLVRFADFDALLGPQGIISGFDREIHSGYKGISLGESKESVLETLGDPRSKSDQFNLPQRQGFEHLFEGAENSHAVEYYQWINGMIWYYCIGFDSSGSVRIKGEGHS